MAPRALAPARRRSPAQVGRLWPLLAGLMGACHWGAVHADPSQTKDVAQRPASVGTAPAAEPTVWVESVELVGHRSFSEAVLLGLLEGQLDREMTLAQMQALALRLQNHYREAGYALATVIVPQQAFTPRTRLRLQVLEGWLGAVTVTGAERYDADRVPATLARGGVSTGLAISPGALEDVMQLLNLQSGVSFSASVKPGEAVGSSDLEVQVQEASRYLGYVELNNYGSKNTGRNRVTTSLQFKNLSGRGDELGVLALRSLGSEKGAYFGRVSYALPLTWPGWSWYGQLSQGNVQVGGAVRVLEIQGANQGASVGVRRDIKFGGTGEAQTFLLTLDAQNLDQTILGEVTSRDRLRKINLQWNWELPPPWRQVFGASLQQGLGARLGGNRPNDPLSSRAAVGADNQFTKLTADYAVAKAVSEQATVQARVTVQYAFDSLLSAEQFAAGGVYSLAGHALSALSGDSGYALNLELRHALTALWDIPAQATLRLDHAQAWLKAPLSGQARSRRLQGLLLGLEALPVPGWQVRLDLGLPLGRLEGAPSYVLNAQIRWNF